jgi:O-antigen ligase
MKNLNKFLLFLNLFLLQAYLIRFHIGGYPSNLQEVLIGINVLFFLITAIKEKRLKEIFLATKSHRIITGFVLLTAISIMLVPVEQYLDFVRFLKFLFFAVVLGFVFLETLQKPEEKEYAIRVAGLGAAIFGIFSVFYNLLGFNITNDLRLNGPLDSAVYLSFYMAPFFIYFFIKSLESPKVKSNIILTSMLGLLILLTRSMGTIGGLFIVLALYAIKRSDLGLMKKQLSKVIFAVLSIIIACTIFYAKILPAIDTKYSSLNERGQIWQTSIYLLKNPQNLIFGVGYGQFENYYIKNVNTVLNGGEPLDYKVLQPHNIFLLFIFNYGILGLLFLSACMYALCKNIYRYHPVKNEKINIHTIAIFVVLYLFIHGLIDTPFFKNDMLFLLILFMELALAQDFKPATKSLKTA